LLTWAFSIDPENFASVVITYQVKGLFSKFSILSEKNQSHLNSLLLRCIALETKVKIIKEEGIVIPKKLFKEMVGTYIKMEQILATLETLGR
jgi:hypothetical protein